MMGLGKSFRELILRVKGETPQKRAEAKNYPSGYEVGLRHPDTSAHVLLGDNGMVDLKASAARLLLQKSNGTAFLEGSAVSLTGKDIHLHADRLWVHGWQQFDPLGMWHSPVAPPPGDLTWTWRFAPLVGNSAELLAALLSMPFVVGDPAQPQYTRPGPGGPAHPPGSGQHTAYLSSMLHPQPLFGPNRQMEMLFKHLAALTKELSHGE
jgi:hypothetical protein